MLKQLVSECVLEETQIQTIETCQTLIDETCTQQTKQVATQVLRDEFAYECAYTREMLVGDCVESLVPVVALETYLQQTSQKIFDDSVEDQLRETTKEAKEEILAELACQQVLKLILGSTEMNQLQDKIRRAKIN